MDCYVLLHATGLLSVYLVHAKHTCIMYFHLRPPAAFLKRPSLLEEFLIFHAVAAIIVVNYEQVLLKLR